MLYPSLLVDPSVRPTTDRLEMILSLADAHGMKVYLGSLQTATEWDDGSEFAALRQYNKLAQEVLAAYGHHPSLQGWYFSQEIWINWVKYYAPSYYGTMLLANFVSDMKALDPTKPVAAAVVFKKDAFGSMPGLTPGEVQSFTTSFLQTTGLQLLMPQDGAGAGAGAPAISELPSYYQAFSNATAANPGTTLWSTVETFTAAANLEGEHYPPATALRIQQQVNTVRPYVTGYVSYIYGGDMSQQATYYPVEASALNRDYQARSKPAAITSYPALRPVSYQSAIQPSPYYPDINNHLSDRTGGGYDNYSLSDWSGYRIEDTGGTATITADLGFVQQITSVRALSMSRTNSGIYHPSVLAVAVSSDGLNYSLLGYASVPGPNTYNFSVGWSELSVAASGRYIRYAFTHQSWLFVSELEILGVPGAPPPPASVAITIDPPSVSLYAGQSQQFTGTVGGSTNTGVSWSLTPALGTISQNGLYTAPGSISSPQSVAVRATSLADGTKTAAAVVTVNPSQTVTPMVGPVNPSSGSGTSQLFRFDATPLSVNLAWVQMLFNSTLSPTNACLVYYDPPSGEMFLSQDGSVANDNTWTGPTLPGTPGTLANSQCSIDAGNSLVSTNGITVSVSLSIRFSAAWSGAQPYIYMAAADTGGNEVGWPVVGFWSVP